MKWNWLVLLATPVLLAGCKNDAPVAEQTPVAMQTAAAPQADEVVILALGDSLFAGYGLALGQSYPAHLEAALRERGIKARIINAGVSGDTTAAALQRTDFVLNDSAKKPALVIISLGGNDMLRGVSPAETRKNLDLLMAKFVAAKVPVLLLGMLAAPNLGADYAKAFNPIYPALAKKYGATLVPFFLQPLVEKPQLVQADHIHPTLAGIDVLVGSTLDQVVKALGKAI